MRDNRNAIVRLIELRTSHMDTKQVKSVLNKNLKIVKKQGKMVKDDVAQKGKELEAMAMREYEIIKKQMNATADKAEAYIKKNPAKAALISAGIGAALAAAGALLLSGSGKKKPSKKKK